MALMHKLNVTMLALAVTAALFPSEVRAGGPVVVRNGLDSGPGSLREALADGADNIMISGNVTEIRIDRTLEYTGTEPLRLVGAGQTIRPSTFLADFTLLESTNGGNLAISNLTFDGGGGFSFDVPSEGKGIFLRVPADRTGIVRLELTNVTVLGVANHGVHVSDCTLGDDCGAGSGGGGDGSPASIHAVLRSVTVLDAGNGRFDADGIRIDERGEGGIIFDAFGSAFVAVGADGVELDEGNDGDVYVSVRNVTFAGNGAYCLPAPLDLAEPCVEDDDGELVLDLDDGMDIDEAGAGGIQGTVILAAVDANLDEGLDIDEEGPGGVTLDIRRLTATLNGDEGLKVTAADAGHVFVTMRGLDIRENGNDGIELETENGDGQVHAEFRNGTARDNDGAGIAMAQEATSPPGTLKVRGSTDIDELDLGNVEEI